MINSCDKTTYEILSKTYPSADEWSCYPFKNFDFNKHVQGIRKTLGIATVKKKNKESFTDLPTKQRLIQLNHKSLLNKKKKIKKLIIGIALTIPLFITVLLFILKILSAKNASIIILLFSLIIFIVLIVPIKTENINKDENTYKVDIFNKFRKHVLRQGDNITVTRKGWIKKNCDCPKDK